MNLFPTENPFSLGMAKDQKFTKTPFHKQSLVLNSVLANNANMGEEEKRSVRETVGALVWLNQLQLHWANGGEGVPEHIKAQLFDGRQPVKLTAATT